MSIPESEWRWFGSPGHFICASDCRFHLCTLIGDYLVSTVGEYLPDSQVREILAQSRGITLTGRGDERQASWLRQVGYEDIGFDRKYETMVFRTTGEVCNRPECNCGLPVIVPSELDTDGYNTAGDATLGHMELCRKYASGA